MKYELGRVEIRKHNRLSHWDAEHAIYFVTFNLADALPERVQEGIRAEAQAQIENIRRLRGDCTIAERNAIEQWQRRQLARALDRGAGSCAMLESRIAGLVADALTYFDGDRYSLCAWCVMPNHVHVVMQLLTPVQNVVFSWKTFTARKANILLGRAGKFWQDGYYDRCIRNSEELSRTVTYVLNNPMKAGLNDWPYVRSYPERLVELV